MAKVPGFAIGFVCKLKDQSMGSAGLECV